MQTKTKTRTKALSWLLSLALILGLLPGMSIPANATDEHSHDGWTATETLPTTEGSYYLTADVELSNTWTVPGTTNLCLNGHKITKTGSSGSVIYIPSGATLNLYDEDNAGIITGGNMSSYPNLYGGGVRIEGGALNMYGGNITGNRANRGGGVYLATGSFMMQGGTISNNNPNMPSDDNWSGGGVFVKQGSFTLKDGLISENVATYGGGVTVNYESGAQFTMLGGAIQGNSAIGRSYIARGGGLDIMGPFSMEGGKISGNYTAGNGGAIYCQNDIVISNGEISGNSADVSAGGIYLTNRAIKISGNVQIKDNVVGGSLDGGIYKGDTKSNVCYFSNGGKINLTGELAQTASIGLTMTKPDVFTQSSDNVKAKDCKSNFFSDNPDMFIEQQEGSDELQLFRQPVSYLDENGEVQECKVYTPVAAKTESWSNGWYVVNDNTSISNRCLASGTVNLILCNGATLTAENGIRVTSGTTLNIFVQSTGESAGKLVTTGSDGQAGIGSDAPTRASWTPSACGTVNIYGGDITATGGKGAAGIGGGARYNAQKNGCAGGTVNIYGGTVTAVAGAADDDKGSSVAIGAGGSAEDHGTLTIGDGMNIYGGTNKNNLAVITKENDNYVRKPYMTISSAPIHIHSFTYEADGATITATCSEADCSLNENKATLTIGAPGDTTSNATVLESEEGLFPGYTVSYSFDGGNTWVDTAPTEQGFYTAKLEWAPEGGKTYTAKIKYGISCITYDTETTNGTINGATNAAVGAMVTPTIEPGEGYELDTLTVTPESGSGINADDIIINGGSFVMPEANVTVSATFKKLNYSVTVSEAANGTVTAVKTTAQMGDAVEISVQSEAGYVLDTLKYNDGTTDTEVTLNADNKYQFTMPAKNVTVTATFAKLTTYTVFYRASGSPTSVLMRFDDSGEGVEMLKSTKLGDNMSCWEIQVSAKEGLTKLTIAFKEDGGSWSNLTDRSVVSEVSQSLSEGNADVLNGNVNIFLVSFVWGDIESKEYSEYIVTDSIESVAVNNPTKNGYTFLGWDDGKSEDLRTADSNGRVNISDIDEATIIAARWKLNTAKVTYNLNGGSGNAPAATANYGTKISAPVNPTKPGYSFARWVVAKNTTQLVGGKESFISAGTAFDFANVAIMNDLELKAEWKHAHAYACLPLNHSAFRGAFDEYVNAGYGDYMHIKICTSMDDYCVEAHSFGSNGKCACGAVKPNPEATLRKTIGDDAAKEIQVKLNSIVALSAPQTSNGKTFTKWQYFDGSNWRNLSTSASTAFVIPSDLEVKAVYEGKKAELNVESFDYNGKIAFYFSYKVPDGYTVVDGGILYGNNQHIRYMLAKKSGNDTYDLSLHGVALYYADISAVSQPVTYEAAKDDATKKFGAKKVANKMYMEQALNISGKSNPLFKSISTLGKAGSTAIAINTSGDNIYYYGMGYVICKAPNGNYVAFTTDAISATRGNPNNSTTANINVQ